MNDCNVVLITIDALRADSLGCMGYHRNTSPTIDKLAEKGLLFTNAFSTSTCTPIAFPGLLYSNYLLFENSSNLATVFRKKGHKTAAFHSNPYLSKYYGYSHGFDVYDDSFKKPLKKKKILPKLKKLVGVKLYSHFNNLLNTFKKPYLSAEKTTEKAIKWLKNTKGRNFFLWVHYMDVHGPYYANNIFLEKVKAQPISFLKNWQMHKQINKKTVAKNTEPLFKDIYDAEIRYVDEQINKLLMTLSAMGVEKNTYIVLTSDHGDEFFEHGSLGHFTKIYDELLRIPIIIKGAGIKPEKINKLTSLIDLAPTFLGILNMVTPKEFKGKNILKNERDHIFAFRKNNLTDFKDLEKDWIFSIRTNKFKFILDNCDNKRELYDLEKDQTEQINIYEENKSIADAFEKEIEKYKAKIGQEKVPAKETLAQEISKEDEERIKDRLKALGYI